MDVFQDQRRPRTVLTALNTTDTLTLDLQGAVTRRHLTVGSNNWYQWFEYDNRGLLWKAFASTSSTKPGTPDVTYTYRPSGQVENRQFLGGPLVPVRYTIREQLEKIGDPALTTYPFSARYAYHPNGTVWEAEFYSAGSPAAQKRYKYVFTTGSYDALNRLKSADFSSWSGSSWTSTLAHDLANLTYDAAGNLRSLRRYRQDATLIDRLGYFYPGTSNRLSSVTDTLGTTTEPWDAETGSFTYDANGNLSTAPAPYSMTAVTYDHQNLPLSLTRSGTTTTYRYDEAGQRLAKQVGSGNRDMYLLAGATTLGLVTVNSSGTPTSWFFNVLAGDRVIGRQPSTGNRRYYHTDLLGSTRAVVEGATVVESYDFEPWGLLMPGRTLAGPTKEGFTGKEQDAETGLDYFGARYYMPALGRWTAVDPLAEKHLEWSPYNYVLNNPLMHLDPDGRQVCMTNPTFCQGVASGAWSAFKGSVAGLVQTVRHPISTAAGVHALLTDPVVQAQAGMAVADAVEQRVDKVASGDPFQVGEVVGEVAVIVGEVVVGSKGAGLLRRASTLDDFANAAQRLRPRPGAAAELRVGNESVRATSGRRGALHPQLQEALDNVPAGARSTVHGACAEINCISDALEAGMSPQGGTISVVRVRGHGNPRHRTPLPPCSTCEQVLRVLGIEIKKP